MLHDLFTLRADNVLVPTACLPVCAITFKQQSWELDFDHANTPLNLGRTSLSKRLLCGGQVCKMFKAKVMVYVTQFQGHIKVKTKKISLTDFVISVVCE